jgi:peptide/nickel transport system ATP-binding protein
MLGLVGESGSGKSLTALSIAGLLSENKKVTGGSILFQKNAGSSVLNLLTLPEKELEVIRGAEISMIFQEPFSSLNPLMKIGDQIAEALKLHGERDKALIKSRVREIMKKLGLPDPEKLANAYPHQLSGGMCQRVMIALAVICRPRLLIADEPTTALDFTTQSQILSLLKEINRDMGASILFISHDLSVIGSNCSRVLVMYSGRILEEGGTEEVFSNPAHEYTRGLLASTPGKANKPQALANIPGRVPSLEEGRPQGCPFHPRCSKVKPACKQSFAPERSVGANHRTRCILSVAEA